MRALHAILVVALAVAAGCGGASSAPPSSPSEPSTSTAAGPPPSGKRWGGWRYTGNRDECFYVVGRRCFADEASACAAASCAEGKRCSSDGAGPATISCE